MKIDNGNRYIATCTTLDNISFIEAIIDTGAMCTVFEAKLIDSKINENSINYTDKKQIGGFIDTLKPIEIFKIKVRKLVIESIILNDVYIWITFDNRVSDNIIGMDILEHLNLLQIADTNKLSIYSKKEELLNNINSQTKYNKVSRKLNKDSKGYYIQLCNMKCYISTNDIKQQNTKKYIILKELNTICILEN